MESKEANSSNTSKGPENDANAQLFNATPTLYKTSKSKSDKDSNPNISQPTSISKVESKAVSCKSNSSKVPSQNPLGNSDLKDRMESTTKVASGKAKKSDELKKAEKKDSFDAVEGKLSSIDQTTISALMDEDEQEYEHQLLQMQFGSYEKSKSDDSDAPVLEGNIGKPVVRVMVPVVITLLFVCVLVNLTCSKDPDRCNEGTLYTLSMPVDIEKPDQDTASNVKAALRFGSIFIAYIAVGTFIMAAFLYFRLTWCLYGYFGIAMAAGISSMMFMLCSIVTGSLELFIDNFTIGFINWNFVVTVLLSFSILKSPKAVRQAILIIFSSLMALMITLMLPPITTWVVLIFLVLWDLFAVLAPCGPLNWIVQMMQKKDKNNKPQVQLPEMMIYSTMAFFFMSSKNKKDKLKQKQKARSNEEASKSKKSDPTLTSSEPVTPSGDPKKKHNISDIRPQLGLGDFVFYSLLIGKTITRKGSTAVTVLFVAITILIGLIFTLMLLFVTRHALPALPISLTLALIVLGVMSYCSESFGEVLNVNTLHI